MKRAVRVMGFDDGAFTFDQGRVALVGVAMRPGIVEHVAIGSATVDGTDATEVIAGLVPGRLHETLQLILLDGACVGGFNVVDARELHRRVDVPVATITPDEPDAAAIRSALEARFDDWRSRWNLLESQWPRRLAIGSGPVQAHTVGLDASDLAQILDAHTVTGRTPEPLRLADMIARALPAPGLPTTRRED